MKKYIYILSAIAIVIGLPLAFKRSNHSLDAKADDTLVIITPHNESIRLEMDLGFREWYYKKTGRTVSIDWRVPGSTGDIVRYINSVFMNAFRLYWEKTLKREWTQEIQENYARSDGKTPLAQEARSAFLASNVGCGMDLFFGGGVIEHKKEAEMGQLVPCGIIEKHPEWFCDDQIPYFLSGDTIWDKDGLWLGTSLSSFGIMYNLDRINDLQLMNLNQWKDLTSPKLFRQIAMVDPMQSSIVIKCLEMMFQQQMKFIRARILKESGAEDLTVEQLHTVLNEGWMNGLKMVQKIMANSRYFTDNSVTTVWDVSIGNCAVGIVVDFYGRHQREVTKLRGGSDRLRFVFPKGGTCISPDPIGLFRGAPNKAVAQAFIEYVVSEEGQDRIGFKTGVEGGPQYYALYRTPVRKDFYVSEKLPKMSSPEMNPFLEDDDFPYQAKWTAGAFSAIRMLSKVLFMDPFTELAKAWKAIIDAQEEGLHEQAQQALDVFENFDTITYDWMMKDLSNMLKSKNPLAKIRLETELTQKFRNQYLEAYRIASQR